MTHPFISCYTNQPSFMTKTINHLLAATALTSVKFAGRKASAPFKAQPKVETLIVDVDRTITKEDSPKIALEALCGKKEAKRIFDGFLTSVIRGKTKVDAVHQMVFSELYSHGFKRGDWSALMEQSEKQGGFRTELIDAILELSKKGLIPVLATRSSKDSAQWIAKRFGFEHVVGSEEKGNGKFEGFSMMIGVSDRSDNDPCHDKAERCLAGSK